MKKYLLLVAFIAFSLTSCKVVKNVLNPDPKPQFAREATMQVNKETVPVVLHNVPKRLNSKIQPGDKLKAENHYKNKKGRKRVKTVKVTIKS